MPKSKHRKKHNTKKKAKKIELLKEKKRLSRYMCHYGKYSEMAESEKKEQRSREMEIIKEWGSSEDNITPTQQMLID